MKYLISSLLITLLYSCSSETDPQRIINKSISYYKMDKLLNSTLEFKFRTADFKLMQKDGNFKYERRFTDSTGNVHDILDNTGFKRILNGTELKLEEKDYLKYSESLNAVIYFLQLPLKLNDPAVIKKYIGETSIKGKRYHKIQISFDQSKGGADHNDVYYYWFDTEDYSMDHFAYSAGGNRFREVLRTQEAGGVIFQDYINYQMPPDDSITTVFKYDSLFEAGKLKELSRIELKNIVLR